MLIWQWNCSHRFVNNLKYLIYFKFIKLEKYKLVITELPPQIVSSACKYYLGSFSLYIELVNRYDYIYYKSDYIIFISFYTHDTPRYIKSFNEILCVKFLPGQQNYGRIDCAVYGLSATISNLKTFVVSIWRHWPPFSLDGSWYAWI